MAITGVLTADFSNFEAAAQRAAQVLKVMESGAIKVEVALDDMSEGSIPSINSLRESVGQVDHVLAASGVNIGKYARGIFEIGEMSGKTVSQLGLLAAGAGLFSAAMAGYQFGTWIAGWTGLADAVDKYVVSHSKLPGEIAAAQQDTINLAIRNGAADTIQYTEAIAFNAKEIQRQIAQQTNWVAVLATAQREARNLTESQKAGIAIMQEAGATTEQITIKYAISALALKVLADNQKLAAQEADAHTKALKEQQAALEKINTDYAKRIDLALHQIKVEDLAAEAAVRRRNEEQASMFENLDIQARIARQAEENAKAAAEAAAEERRIAANQADIDRILSAGAAPQARPPAAASAFGGHPGFASVMNAPPSIVINAQGALLNNPGTLNDLARLVEDAITQRSGLTTTHTRR